MINYETKNQSFIDMQQFLERSGVKNNSFMLELKDESLKDFKLSDLETNNRDKRSYLMNKVLEECRNNIWFFFREFIKLPNRVAFFTLENSNIKFKKYDYLLNDIEMAMIYMYDNGINFLSYIDSKVPRGVQTTIYLLEMYDSLFRKKNKAENILLYNDVNDNYFTFKMLAITNNESLANDYIVDDFTKSLVIHKPDEEDQTSWYIDSDMNYFMHIYDWKPDGKLLSKIYTILHKYRLNTHLFGVHNSIDYVCWDEYDLKNNDEATSDIFKNLTFMLMMVKLRSTLPIYDITDKYKNDKLYVI